MMRELCFCACSPATDDYDLRLHRGDYIDVSGQAPSWFRGQAVAVEAMTYERYVAWGSAATRRHGQHQEEGPRLEALLNASGCAAVSAGGCFICRAVDTQGADGREQRHLLTMTNFGKAASPRWLIHE